MNKAIYTFSNISLVLAIISLEVFLEENLTPVLLLNHILPLYLHINKKVIIGFGVDVWCGPIQLTHFH